MVESITSPNYELTVEDIEYRRVDGEPLLARLYQPQGKGPFPAVVGVHGGAWTSGDRKQNEAIDLAVAAGGAVVMALDFRLSPATQYPGSVADINFAIRWLKANAPKFNSRADWVGAVGASSGAHQMLLTALRPRDPRYLSPDLDGFDAEISFAVACWPIADPLVRYRMAREKKNERLVSAHEAFFGTEELMTDANPQLILQRGEQSSLPPLLVLQGTKDDNVTPDMAERFVSSYRAAGGRADLETFENQPHTFVTRDPTTASSLKAIDSIRGFVLSRGRAE